MTTFIYTLQLLAEYQKESNWTPKTKEIVSAHFEYLKDLQAQGVVVLAGRTNYSIENPLNFGIVVFYATDEVAAKNLMENDPSFKQEVMTAKLHPFSIALLAKA